MKSPRPEPPEYVCQLAYTRLWDGSTVVDVCTWGGLREAREEEIALLVAEPAASVADCEDDVRLRIHQWMLHKFSSHHLLPALLPSPSAGYRHLGPRTSAEIAPGYLRAGRAARARSPGSREYGAFLQAA
jgi:hypothetical protein